MRNHGPDTVNVALYVSPCCADIERNRSKKGGFFLQETMPCIHGPSLCVCMPALVVAVLIAYDYECARKLSASLFLGSQKQAFLASWLWALIVYIFPWWYFHNSTMHQFTLMKPTRYHEYMFCFHWCKCCDTF